MVTTKKPPSSNTVDDGWGLPSEPRRSTRAAATAVAVASQVGRDYSWVDDGWVLPPEWETKEPEAGPAVGAAAVAAKDPDRVDLNTATIDELCNVRGVGRNKAADIVKWRDANGRFATIEDLANVRGFGAKSVAKLADRFTVSS